MDVRRPEVGIPLREAAPFVALVKWLFVEDYEIKNPEEGIPRRDGVTVYVCNHGPVIAPVPAPALTVEMLLQRGGYDDLLAVTLFHWVVELVPGMAPVLRRYFGHATRKMRTVDQVVEAMRAGQFQIIGTAPEGASCSLSYDEAVGPFTRHGLLIAGLRAGADLVLTAQRGTEVFGKELPFPAGLRVPAFGKPARGLLLPRWSPRRRARVTLEYRRFVPRLSPEALEALPPDQRRAHIGEELRRIQRELCELHRAGAPAR